MFSEFVNLFDHNFRKKETAHCKSWKYCKDSIGMLQSSCLTQKGESHKPSFTFGE
jgi:hypothetical protein